MEAVLGRTVNQVALDSIDDYLSGTARSIQRHKHIHAITRLGTKARFQSSGERMFFSINGPGTKRISIRKSASRGSCYTVIKVILARPDT